MNEIKKLFEIIGHKRTIVYIMLLSMVVALIEFIGLALILPYIAIATEQEIPQSIYLKPILEFFDIDTFSKFMIYLSLFIVAFYIFRLFINLFFRYISLQFTNKIRHIVMSRLFSHYAHIDYIHFVVRNSSVLKRTLIGESANIQNILKSVIEIVSELFVLLLLLGLVLYTDWKLSLILLTVFSVVFYSITLLLKAKILLIADERKIYGQGIHKQVDETLRNFKFTKLIGAEKIKTILFEENSYGLYRVSTAFGILSQFPKYILETLGLIIIVGIIFYLVQTSSSDSLISTLGVYAIAFYRTLPALNKIIISFNSFQFFKNTIDLVSQELKIEREDYKDEHNVLFKEKIELKNLTFGYKDTTSLFSEFNISISKGQKIAITGSSGCGKSTLVDLFMGILKPQKGILSVDGYEINDKNMKAWRQKFGYIPQEIYLYDASVADNVAFGRDYDEERVIEVLKQANIYEYLQTKNGIETLVGEAGIQLSGGQKQRIGIARALYQNPDILVLDEATSALDSKTEEKIMDEIYRICKDKTLIIIAHRLSTIEQCDDKVYL